MTARIIRTPTASIRVRGKASRFPSEDAALRPIVEEVQEMSSYYLEDFEAGQRFGGAARIRIEKDRIMTFAAEFDPQPFHLDEQAASNSIFRGLAASGWHTAAATMRLLVESELITEATK
jgi:acyl dehydratase